MVGCSVVLCNMIEAGRIEGNTAETETNLVQKTPSCITAEENNNGFMKPNMRPEKGKVQVLPFYFVNIWQKDVTFITRIKDAIKLFEEGEQYHFEISDKIKRKKLDRDRQISKLNDLNKDYQRLKGDVSMRRASLQDKYKALEEIRFLDKADRGRSIKSSSNKKQLKEHTRQLKFQILHGCKTLAEERRALQEKKLLDQWGAASVSPLQGISSPTLSNKLHGEIQNLPRWKKNPIANVTIMPKTWTPLKQSIRNEAEIICDELMEMRRKKKELENNIKIVEKELESTNTKLWSFRIDDLKHEQDMKDASLCIVNQTELYNTKLWVLTSFNLEDHCKYGHTIYCDSYDATEEWKGLNLSQQISYLKARYPDRNYFTYRGLIYYA